MVAYTCKKKKKKNERHLVTCFTGCLFYFMTKSEVIAVQREGGPVKFINLSTWHLMQNKYGLKPVATSVPKIVSDRMDMETPKRVNKRRISRK